MGKPTTKDLAKAAGVSLATVDRVLNQRAGVRAATVERVQKAIEKIGFVRDLSAANLARGKEYRLLFMLPEHDDPFTDLIRLAVAEANVAIAHERTAAEIIRVAADDPYRLTEQLDRLCPDTIDGVAIMAPETPQVRDAVARLNARGIAVVAFASAQPNAEVAHYVGINNEAAGRTVAQLMGRFTGACAGRVLVICETMQARDSQERRHGFDATIGDFAPRLRASPSLETRGEAQRTHRILSAAFQGEEPVVGVYLMGHEIEAELAAIDAGGRDRDLVVIGHELTTQARARLVDGTLDAVIAQDVRHMVRSSIRTLRARADGLDTIPSQERIRIEIILRENMPG